VKGTKRRASVSLVPPGTSKRQNEAISEVEDLDSVGAPREDDSDVIVIPDGQADAERVGLDTAQEIPEHNTEVAVFDDWPEHEAWRYSTALLLFCHGGEPLTPEEYAGWQSSRIARVAYHCSITICSAISVHPIIGRTRSRSSSRHGMYVSSTHL